MQMLFIIPLLKTENPYYIIVNILTDNGENTMQNEKTSVLVLAQCDLTMRETLNTRFGTQCAFTFAENGEHPPQSSFARLRLFSANRVKLSWRRPKTCVCCS